MVIGGLLRSGDGIASDKDATIGEDDIVAEVTKSTSDLPPGSEEIVVSDPVGAVPEVDEVTPAALDPVGKVLKSEVPHAGIDWITRAHETEPGAGDRGNLCLAGNVTKEGQGEVSIGGIPLDE